MFGAFAAVDLEPDVLEPVALVTRTFGPDALGTTAFGATAFEVLCFAALCFAALCFDEAGLGLVAFFAAGFGEGVGEGVDEKGKEVSTTMFSTIAPALRILRPLVAVEQIARSVARAIPSGFKEARAQRKERMFDANVSKSEQA